MGKHADFGTRKDMSWSKALKFQWIRSFDLVLMGRRQIAIWSRGQCLFEGKICRDLWKRTFHWQKIEYVQFPIKCWAKLFFWKYRINDDSTYPPPWTDVELSLWAGITVRWVNRQINTLSNHYGEHIQVAYKYCQHLNALKRYLTNEEFHTEVLNG